MTERQLKRMLGKPCPPSHAPLSRVERTDSRLQWQLKVWREATGLKSPQVVDAPLLSLEEAGRVMIALKRRKPLELRIVPEYVKRT